MSDCPYIGTTVIHKEPWGYWPAGESESDDSDWEFDSRRKMLKLMKEKEKALAEAVRKINKLRGDVATLTSENKRLLDVINKMSSDGKEGAGT